ncbi:hypothetical protein VSDG_03781 [Cytospora chrysosperma]|uniref:Uncharacterized protein n=1 Tax=Cytospora chrysosperma TaxID=252740 RepID=A0A423W6C9_CYTCH|nr:hypothetical protein VSDG_03781 [Valsa sordida]
MPFGLGVRKWTCEFGLRFPIPFLVLVLVLVLILILILSIPLIIFLILILILILLPSIQLQQDGAFGLGVWLLQVCLVWQFWLVVQHQW